LRPLNHGELAGINDGEEESVLFEFDKVVHCVAFSKAFTLQIDRHLAIGIVTNLGKEESVGISDSQDTRALRQGCLVALRETLHTLNMRFRLHAGHVNEVEKAFVLDG